MDSTPIVRVFGSSPRLAIATEQSGLPRRLAAKLRDQKPD
jgi:hypothetical protein